MTGLSYQTAKYEEQLPKKKGWAWPRLYNYIAGSSSLIALIIAPNFFPQEKVPLVCSIALVLLVTSLLIHTYLNDRRKLHRYAQSTLYMHYVNHIIRDSLSAMEDNNFSDTKTMLDEIVNSISNCFNLLTGKQCRCCIKELKDDLTVKTVVRDNISRKREHLCAMQDREGHGLDDNTDFYNLWYSLHGCSRYFYCDNLINLWKTKQYKNSSFKILGKPRVKTYCGFMTFVADWKLPYKSTIVLPIRYFSEFSPPTTQPNEDSSPKQKADYPHWKFWGFLCIDCNSRKIFDSEFSPELGGAFADILYIYLTQTKILLDKANSGIIKSDVQKR